MKYTVDMGWSAIICIHSFIKFGPALQRLIGRKHIHTDTHRNSRVILSLLPSKGRTIHRSTDSPLIGHGRHTRRHLQQFFYCCVVFVVAVMFFPSSYLATYTKRTDWWEVFRKYAIQMGSRATLYIPPLSLSLSLSLSPVAPTSKHRTSVKQFVPLQFLNPKTVGKIPWTGDQPVTRPLPI
jgi:hypothetical protein